MKKNLKKIIAVFGITSFLLNSLIVSAEVKQEDIDRVHIAPELNREDVPDYVIEDILEDENGIDPEAVTIYDYGEAESEEADSISDNKEITSEGFGGKIISRIMEVLTYVYKTINM